jgi:hypothetical protein
MNAQEALNTILKGYDDDDDGQWEESEIILQKLINQSNAKPKTLEELGWSEVEHISVFGIPYTTYEKANLTINFTQTKHKVRVFDYYCGDKRPCGLSYEEIIAIAEKMKELGMTSEIAKGETNV